MGFKGMKAEDRISKYIFELKLISKSEQKNRLIGMLEVARACRETKLVKIIRNELERINFQEIN